MMDAHDPRRPLTYQYQLDPVWLAGSLIAVSAVVFVISVAALVRVAAKLWKGNI